MICSYCKKPVVLSPSAAERAAKDVTGKSAAYYTSLFPNHAACELAARDVPLPRTPIKDLPPMFRQEGMLMLRNQAMKTFWGWCGSEEAARKVNAMDEEQLLKLIA